MTIAAEEIKNQRGRGAVGGSAGVIAAAPEKRMPQQKRRFGPAAAGLILLCAAAAGVGIYKYTQSGGGDGGTVLTYTVHKDALDVRIPLNGEMKASRNIEIRNQVEGQT